MQLGNICTISPIYVRRIDMLNIRFIHRKTLDSQPLRVVDYCAYILEIFIFYLMPSLSLKTHSGREHLRLLLRPVS